MAIRTFNSVGGFSVGENPETIILPNGDITTDFATFSANVDAGKIKTDYLLYANGVPWDFQEAAGAADGQIQYYLDGDFGASSKFVFDPTSNVLTVTGNANVTDTFVTGNLRTDNLLYANGVAWDLQEAAGSDTQIQFNTGDNFDASANLTFDSASNLLKVTGNANVTNTLATGNLRTDNLLYANGVAWDIQQAAGDASQIQFNTGDDFDASANLTFDATNSILAVVGKVTVTGNVEAPRFIGNLVGNVTGNVNFGGTDKTIAFVKGSNLYYSSNLQFDYTSNVLTLTGNLEASNANLGNLTTSNYFHGVFDATSSSQPNIHTVGTLDYLDVDTTITATDVETGNLSVADKVVTHLIPSTNNTYDLGSSTSYWRNVYAGSNIFFNDNAYLRAIGSVVYTDAMYIENGMSAATVTSRGDAFLEGDVTVSGNLTVSGSTTYINVTNMDVKDPLISLGGSGNGANLAHYDGKDRGLVLRNRTSDDQFVQNQAFIWSTTNDEFRAFANVTSIAGEVVEGDIYANIHGNVFKGNVEGLILTNNQTYINQVGVLDDLVVDGTLQVNTHANVASFEASGMQYPLTDGSQRQVLSTDGQGELYWATIDTYRLANGTSNVSVAGPGPDNPTGLGGTVSVSVGGVADVVVIDTNQVDITGNLVVTDTTTTNVLKVANSTVGTAVLTTSSISTDTILSLAVADFRAVEYFIKGEDDTAYKYSVATISAVHNSVDAVEYSTYGAIHSGASTGTFDVVYDDSDPDNHLIKLKVTPSSGNETVWTVQYRII